MARVGSSISGPAAATRVRRALWAPAIAVLVLAGHVVLRGTPEAPAPVPVPAAASVFVAAAPQHAAGMRRDRLARDVDEATALHETLDPVGAGHDTPR